MRVAVVGAGIGGLVTASGLQADGHEVTVYEQRAEPGAVGAGLTLFGNALGALDAIGLGDCVRQISSDAIGRLRSGQRRPSGQWLVSLPSSMPVTVRSLHRSDLHRALLELLAKNTLRLGVTATVSPDGVPGIEVDGDMETFDLVVAADGLRSDARRLWDLDRGVRYAGFTAWRGVTASRGHLADEAGETWGLGARFGIVPLPDERVYWFATLSTPAGVTFDDDRGILRETFGSWHRPIPEIIEATPNDDILQHDIHDLAELPPSFVTRRGVLLGDAAHAMTPDLGQGAGQAIEDAATLILLLRQVHDNSSALDLDAALSRYDQLRRTRTRTLWRRSRLAGQLGQISNPLHAHLRNAALTAMPAALMAHSMKNVQRWASP